MDAKFLELWAPRVLSILRIVAAVLFFEHGLQKMLDIPARPDGASPPVMFSMIWYSGVLEFFGGALLTLGLFTRPVAFLLSGQMAVGYWTMHALKSFFPLLNQGDAAILYCFVFLYLVFAGPGPWSVDAAMKKSSTT
jgi:putative oxidoreductase